MSSSRGLDAPGPFRAEHLPPKSHYEISRGHAIRVAPTGGEGATAQGNAYAIIASDPKVRRAGTDPGFKLADGTLRAPDVAILPEDAPSGWIPGAPPLAFEYAGIGQDEEALQTKIGELIAAGTRYLWVVRLVGPHRVECYENGRFRVAVLGDVLSAPDLLENAIPVSALFDDDEAREMQLRNLLQRHGYRSIEAVSEASFAEGREQGREQGIEASRGVARDALLSALDARGLPPDDAHRDRIAKAELQTLLRWLVASGRASRLSEVFED